MPKLKLAVIGGGAAGHQIAYDLREEMDVTLIDPKTYWEVPMAFPRLLVDPTALPARMDFAEFLSPAQHAQGLATAISADSVTVTVGGTTTKIPFDVAVIATGSRYLDPLVKAEATTAAAREAEIAAASAMLSHAKAVVIAGGGPVGVEVAAELRENFPGLAITLVHDGRRLLETGPDRFPDWSEATLAQRKITVVAGERVVAPAIGQQPIDGSVTLASGRTLPADTVVWAVGTVPNTDFVKQSWPAAVDGRSLIRTDGYLRVAGHSNVFVAGDVTDLPEGRLVITASFHVTSIAANLKAIAAAGSVAAAKLKAYKPVLPGKGMGKLMVVTLGRRDGLTSTPMGQFRASWLARTIKSHDMFVPKYRKMVGLKG